MGTLYRVQVRAVGHCQRRPETPAKSRLPGRELMIYWSIDCNTQIDQKERPYKVMTIEEIIRSVLESFARITQYHSE